MDRQRGPGRGGGQPRLTDQNRRGQELSIAKLREIYNINNGQQTLTAIMSRESEFQGTLDTNVSMEKFEMLSAAIAKAVDHDTVPATVLKLLNMVKNSQFLWKYLPDYIFNVMKYPVDEGVLKTNTIQYNVQILQILLHRLPSSSALVNSALSVIEGGIKGIRLNNVDIITPQIEQEVKHLRTAIDKVIADTNVRMNPDQVEQENIDPPDDYRFVQILPAVHEIRMNEKPFLRKNLEIGGFEDLNHYLDIQFRLLREDFMRPLRDGINIHLNKRAHNRRNVRNTDVRIYTDVRISHSACHNKKLVHQVRFNVDALRHIRWRSSRRLIFGSLLCFSKDHFRTMMFATVADRHPEQLRKGYLYVMFENEEQRLGAAGENDIFVMAESTAYFEAYRHVLRGLQQIDCLPFSNYIIYCRHNIRPPIYLKDDSTFDLSTLANESEITSSIAQPEGLDQVLMKKGAPWPTPGQIDLDESQFEALQSALLSEFVLIQGPPGTGKTYIGLKMVKTLLKNKRAWQGDDQHSPILVVCYTNHALDQFLEGVLELTGCTLARVGGRSQSEKLKDLNMRELRRRNRLGTAEETQLWDIRRKCLSGMDELNGKINSLSGQIQASYEGILKDDVLFDHMEFRLYESLLNSPKLGATSFLVEWLDIWRTEVDEANQAATEEDIQIEGRVAQEVNRRMLDFDNDDVAGRADPYAVVPDASILAFGNNFALMSLERDHKTNKREFKTKLSMVQAELRKNDVMPADDIRQLTDIWVLTPPERWRLYRTWAQAYRDHVKANIRQLEGDFEEASKRCEESQIQHDKLILEQYDVIGMTTTGAAKSRDVLQQLKPKIIICEEAAEVLEAHIVTSLNANCQQLILIGDHKQLRPSPTVHELALKYNLSISLFERMFNNGIPCITLMYQHRMRPEIANIMRLIYPDLRDHDVVNNYPPVRGIATNVYFIDHMEPETGDQDTSSKANHYEAWYTAELCNYLLKQGYSAKHITILTPYTGQLFTLKKYAKGKCDGVRICAVDNFQGEENDIIILSLVRSNEEATIGFLGEENRLCVALSRAKMGLYVIGNFTLFGAVSDHWNKIISHLRKYDRIGNTLQLKCQNHPKEQVMIHQPTDFEKAPEGGCSEPCNFRLKCGHVCTRICHPYDTGHLDYKCLKQCPEILCPNGHRCPKTCGEPCGDCQILVPKTMPRCGHNQRIPCCKNPQDITCKERCQYVLPCTHTCQEICGALHTTKCKVKSLVPLPCEHKQQVECHQKKEYVICTEPCKATLGCSHPCQGSCGGCANEKLHVPCSSPCQRSLVCGHICNVSCTNDCPPCTRACRNTCSHSKCSNRCGVPCKPCNERCFWWCKHYKCTMLCNEMCNRPQCDEACDEILQCGHPCAGLCGEKCPSLCRICNAQEIGEMLFGTEGEPNARYIELEDCGHVVEVTGMDHWMEVDTTGDADEVIQLKRCPKCKEPIRKTLRYGNMLKLLLNDIENIKKMMAKDVDVGDIKRQATREIDASPTRDDPLIVKLKNDLEDDGVSPGEIQCIRTVVIYYTELADIKLTLQTLSSERYRALLSYEIEQYQKWLGMPRNFLSEQERNDGREELYRLTHLANAFVVRLNWESVKEKAPIECRRQFSPLYTILTSRKPLRGEEPRIREAIQELKRHCTGLAISERERIEIMEAMSDGARKGSWYKCQNGHYYQIDRCGGAMVESKCPECGVTIGGRQHRLTSGNRHAPEMDGSDRAAWPQ